MKCKNNVLRHTSYFLRKYALITLLSSISLGLFGQSDVNKDLNSASPSFTLVLDAGHGGKDSGCLGKYSMEKDIVLSLCKLIKGQLLEKDHKIDVILTRDKDEFIPLHERSRLANDVNADLFISVHCNGVKNTKVHGSETFVMGLHKAEENLAVAKRENESIYLESDYQTQYQGYDPNSPIGHILLSTYQNIYLDKSIALASKVEDKLSSLGKVSRGVKQAGFVVLREATMPSVLIEAGFLTNLNDEAYLMSTEGQKAVAEKISLAILEMKKDLKKEEVVKKGKIEIKPISSRDYAPDIAQASDVLYKLQLAALSKKPTPKVLEPFEVFPHLEVIVSNGVSKILVGEFDNLERALHYQDTMRQRGYTDAFLVKM
jgi:N-acetylmuramoyl-L-alanine amidase